MKDNYLVLLILISIVLCSCTSFKENVRSNKRKFIQVGIENSQPVDVNHLESIYSTAQANNTEGKTKALDVENLETLYMDSLVVFHNGTEVAVYDFAAKEQEMGSIEKKLQLAHIERVDHRLYYGEK
jgi:hypothetical protein